MLMPHEETPVVPLGKRDGNSQGFDGNRSKTLPGILANDSCYLVQIGIRQICQAEISSG